jgi:hypothetical protein
MTPAASGNSTGALDRAHRKGRRGFDSGGRCATREGSNRAGFRNRQRNAVRVMLKAGGLSQRVSRFGNDLFLKCKQHQEA